MSINTVISEALSPLGLPVAFNVYQGAEKRHIVFNYFTTPDDFGDDAPGCEIYHVQVHFYGPYGSNDAAYFCMMPALHGRRCRTSAIGTGTILSLSASTVTRWDNGQDCY